MLSHIHSSAARLRARAHPSVAAIAAATGLVLLLAGLAVAQSGVPIAITVSDRVTPNKAGTVRHPQGVVYSMDARIAIPDDYSPPLVNTVDIWVPRGFVYNGAHYPACSQSTLSQRGPGGCPPGSIVGHGSGDAYADHVLSHPQLTIVNGGATRAYVYTVLNNPARVQAPIPATITRTPGPWPYHVQATVPRVLQVVAGIPVRLTRVQITMGRGSWIATTSCPGGRWSWHAVVTFTTGQTTPVNGSVGCR